MKSMKKTILKVTLSLVLTFGLIASLPYNQSSVVAKETSSNSTVDIDTTTNYNADNTEASIIFDVDSFKHTIVNVKDINDQIIQVGKNHEYVVSENKDYKFTITYTDKNNTEKSFVKTVTIDKIGTNGTNSANAWRSPLLRSSVRSGGAQISIPDYDGIGWEAPRGTIKNSKKVSFSINFEDVSSTGKKAKITIPDGMDVVTLSVIGSKTDYPGVNENMLNFYQSSNPLSNSITNMTVPQSDGLKNTYGDITYDFIDSTQFVNIEIELSISSAKFYGPHKIKNPISVVAEKEGVIIGSVNQEINAIGEDITTVATSYSGDYSLNLENSKELDDLSQGITPNFNARLYNGSYRYATNYEVYQHYPTGMSFVQALPSSNDQVKNIDEEKNEVVFYSKDEGWFSNTDSSQIKYQVPLGLEPGKYTIPYADYTSYTFYDGSVGTITKSSGLYTVNLQNELDNKFTDVTSYTESVTHGFDNTVSDEHFSYVGAFMIENKTGNTITDQVFEMSVEPSFKALSVYVPKGNDEISNIIYKTNVNSNERSYTGVVPEYTKKNDNDPSPNMFTEISTDMLGLNAGEYITYVKADIGSFNDGYTTNDMNDRIVLYGQLVNGEENANLIYNIYDKNDESGSRVTQSRVIRKAGPTVRVDSVASGGFSASKVSAGQSYVTKSEMRLHASVLSFSSQSAIIADPVLYVIDEDGFYSKISDMVMKDQSGNVISFTYNSRVLDDGRKLYTINPDFDFIAAYIGDKRTVAEEKYLTFEFETNTKITSSGTTTGYNIFWGGRETFHYGQTTDTIDYDQDGNVTEKFLRAVDRSKAVQVLKNNNVLVETGLSIDGEPSLPSYEVGDENTIARFSPGTNADLRVDVLNNDEVPANDTTVYIPIPKTGVDFGEHFQTEAFTWDMRLRTAVPAVSGTEVAYSTDSAPGKYVDGEATYSTTLPDNLSDVTMVKITSTDSLPVNARATFHVPLVVDETFESATSGDKVGKLNVFYPTYFVDSSNYVGRLSGTTVATELILTSIGGTIFEDSDANGLYDASVDELMPGHAVELYMLNETSGEYEAYEKDGKHLTVTSDANGVYEFHSDLDLPIGNYAIRFVEKAGAVYQYTLKNVSDAAADKLIDSDAIMVNDEPNPGDTYRGWVLDIDVTRAEAKTIGVGFLQYDPPVDLKVSINEEPSEVKVGETITVGSVVSPTFFDEIKHPDTPYTWKIVGGASEEAKATLINNEDGTVTIVPSESVKGTTTIDIELTITDAYGESKTSEIVTINIISDTPPTLTAEDIYTYVGNPVSELVSNSSLTAVDNAGNDLPVVFTAGATNNTKFTHTAPNNGSVFTETGTYEVTYSVTDKWGNVGTVTKLVKVNEGPTVTSYGSQYVLGTAEADILADVANDVNASWLKAPDAVGAAVDTTIAGPATTTGGNDTIKYELDASNPSSDFSVTGVYKVNYTATNPDGKVATTSKEVLIVGTEVEVNEAGLMISAVGFVVEQKDKTTLTQDMAKDVDHSNVEAYKVIKDAEGNITSYVDLTEDVTLKNSEVINSVNNAPDTGGIYSATYEIKNDGGSAEVTVAIIVNGTTVTIENGIAIYADSFVIENDEAATMDDAKVVTHGNIVAVRLSDSTFITNITSDTVQLDAIKSVTASGGIFPLTVTATDNNDSMSKDIKVTVKGYNETIENGISIYAESFKIPNAEAAVLDSNIVLYTSNAKAVNSVTGVELTDLTVNAEELAAINAATSRGGIFKLTINASEDDRTATKVIYVTVEGTLVNVGDLTITAEGFNLGQNSAELLNEDKAKEMSGVFAVDTLTGQPVTDIKVNPEDIKNINNDTGTGGVYELTFTATNEAGNSVSITVYVTVEGSNVIIENGIAIYADSFVIENDEAATMDDTKVVTHGNIIAVRISDNMLITNITSDTVQLDAIKAATASGGIFPLTVTATDNNDSMSKDIKVTVKGYNEAIENGISIYAESFKISNAEAATLDSNLALSTSNAKAVNSVTGVELTDLTVNAEELAAINAATSRGGIFKLTINASEDDRTATKVIYVTVEGTQVDIGDLTITAEGFNLGQNSAELLNEDKAKEMSGVFAVDTLTGQPVTDIKVNPEDIKNINNDDGTGGVYELTFIATNEAGNSVSITVYVTVEGSNVSVINGIAIEAYGFTVPYAESLTLTTRDVFEKSEIKAWYVVDNTMIEEIKIDIDHLSVIHKGPKSGGIYDIMASVNGDSTTRTGEKTAVMIPVTVIGEIDQPKEIAQTGYNASALLFSMILTALLGFIIVVRRRKTFN